jgi:hypothetical protein
MLLYYGIINRLELNAWGIIYSTGSYILRWKLFIIVFQKSFSAKGFFTFNIAFPINFQIYAE